MPDAIIFDLDDTIILFETPTTTIWESAIARFNLDVKTVNSAIRAAADWYWADLDRHRAGRLDLRNTRREISRTAFERLGRTDFALAEKIADTYSDERDNGGVLAPGAKELLQDLKKRRIRLGMITNGASDMQREKINQYDLAPFFDNILVEGEFICGKPDERVFKHTLEKLKAKPESTWMVGDDMRFDIAPCHTLGIYTLWVNGKGDDSRKIEGITPDKTIKSISEIQRML